MKFLSLTMGIGPNDRGALFYVCLPVPGFEPTTPVFIGGCLTKQATVAVPGKLKQVK